jgi:hypothetical protein
MLREIILAQCIDVALYGLIPGNAHSAGTWNRRQWFGWSDLTCKSSLQPSYTLPPAELAESTGSS